MHRNSALLFEKHARPFFKSHMRVLEIGPDKLPSSYRGLVGDDTIQWDYLDIHPYPGEGLTYVAKDEYTFPVPDEAVDLVFSAQVIEHVRKIWVWIKEVARVCKKGGTVITINPVSWPYHEHPYDCWRMYPEGMKALYEEGGLTMKVSAFESLDRSFVHLLKQAAKPFLGRRMTVHCVVIDNISIGVKE